MQCAALNIFPYFVYQGYLGKLARKKGYFPSFLFYTFLIDLFLFVYKNPILPFSRYLVGDFGQTQVTGTVVGN